MTRKAYPSDVSDDEWVFVAPYLTWMSEAAPQRDYELREIFNDLRWIVRAGNEPVTMEQTQTGPQSASGR